MDIGLKDVGGADGTRTRDPRRDRPYNWQAQGFETNI